jgi:predicted lipoprotein with Yx(FWY)xxD motif
MNKRLALRRLPKTALLLVIVGLSLLAAACSSSPSSSSGLQPRPGKSGLTLFGYKTTLGQAVGSIAGIVAYTDTAENGNHFVCTSSSCTTTWHPWLTDGAKVRAAAGVQQSLVGTVKRPDGTVQMTYGGHPLYLYAHTKQAVQANAQGAGGVWYVVGTDGNVIK